VNLQEKREIKMIENKKRVTKALKEKKIDAAIDTKWPFIGPFLKFLESKGILKELKNILGENRRISIPKSIITLMYIIKLIVGIPRIRGSEALLADFGAMRLLGFDMDTIENGSCNRGDANQYGKGYKKNHWRARSIYINLQHRKIFQGKYD
jgi:hypothetical protein